MKPETFKPLQPESEPNKEVLEQQYLVLLTSYREKFGELKELIRKNPGGITDPEIKAQINFIDQERHQIHLKLIELGLKLGKTKGEVLVDILGNEGNLGEYGLPEFSIKTAQDFFYAQGELGDGVLLLFDHGYASEEEEIGYSEDHKERIKRAKLLAKKINGKIAEIATGSFHDEEVFFGVVFPKEDLEKVMAIIRNNPKKFRLGKEFYE